MNTQLSQKSTVTAIQRIICGMKKRKKTKTTRHKKKNL
ncbi:hypothetical protein CHCC14600_2082 [Bacillus licheniformis]|nr:hypothetical protein CHCC15543_4428 [Bacillus licheniformis]TWL62245.1 hypothetical protein CHCC15322_2094 [Bacillus licheniformis]TWL83518.1 hypothetical protein CHCC15311_1040 [Bacillus licheniformis]TWM58197.1 hypothetical protein CHCC14813_1887 [Bacillus licheniformis]TWM79017.1 hypothetical protein CHCC14808_2346 [Bacillus licheniformis]